MNLHLIASKSLLAFLPHTTIEWVVGAVTLSGVGLAAYLQETVVPAEQPLVGVVTAVIQALTVGGGLAAGGTFFLRRLVRYMDEREAYRREEIAADRAERERFFAQRDAEVARLASINEMLIQKLIARIDPPS